MSPAETILTVVSMTLAVAAFVCAWDARKYAQQASEARERTRRAYEQIERLRRENGA